MSSDKRQFNDFTSFGGQLKQNIYVYPTLYTIDTHGKHRYWRIFVRLIKGPKAPAYKYGWDTSLDTVVPIKKDYLENADALPNDVQAQVWTESGIKNGIMARSAPTYTKPVNIGRANERNKLQQALVKARAAYLKQCDKGGLTATELQKILAQKPKKDKYFPMLARNFKNEKQHITYPVVVQPKLDGMRCIAFLVKDGGEERVSLYSRNLKDIEGFTRLRAELLPFLRNAFRENGSIYIDGEFYRHGAKLQEIVGHVRNIQKNESACSVLQLHIFDAFYIDSDANKAVDTPYFKRLELLEPFKNANSKLFEVVPFWVAQNEKEVMELYKKCISDGYEGIMVKDPNAAYLTSTASNANIRSRYVLKLKGHFDEEYPIVGFTDGAGKDKGALIWILETSEGRRFNATPKNMTYKERYDMFSRLKANPDIFKKYEGQKITVEFQDKSKDDVPLRAKAIIIRDYE